MAVVMVTVTTQSDQTAWRSRWRCPVGGQQWSQVIIGRHRWQATEHVTQIRLLSFTAAGESFGVGMGPVVVQALVEKCDGVVGVDATTSGSRYIFESVGFVL